MTKEEIINEIITNPNISIPELINSIKQIQRKQSEDEIKSFLSNSPWVPPRCFRRKIEPKHGTFPPCYRYYKIISTRSINIYHVECLIFNEVPTYWFEYNSSKIGMSGDHYLGHFDFNSFFTDSISTNLLKEAEEITEEEYWIAAKDYLANLKSLTWYCDHYRMGGKMPTDPSWPI